MPAARSVNPIPFGRRARLRRDRCTKSLNHQNRVEFDSVGANHVATLHCLLRVNCVSGRALLSGSSAEKRRFTVPPLDMASGRSSRRNAFRRRERFEIGHSYSTTVSQALHAGIPLSKHSPADFSKTLCVPNVVHELGHNGCRRGTYRINKMPALRWFDAEVLLQDIR